MHKRNSRLGACAAFEISLDFFSIFSSTCGGCGTTQLEYLHETELWNSIYITHYKGFTPQKTSYFTEDDTKVGDIGWMKAVTSS